MGFYAVSPLTPINRGHVPPAPSTSAPTAPPSSANQPSATSAPPHSTQHTQPPPPSAQAMTAPMAPRLPSKDHMHGSPVPPSEQHPGNTPSTQRIAGSKVEPTTTPAATTTTTTAAPATGGATGKNPAAAASAMDITIAHTIAHDVDMRDAHHTQSSATQKSVQTAVRAPLPAKMPKQQTKGGPPPPPTQTPREHTTAAATVTTATAAAAAAATTITTSTANNPPHNAPINPDEHIDVSHPGVSAAAAASHASTTHQWHAAEVLDPTAGVDEEAHRATLLLLQLKAHHTWDHKHVLPHTPPYVAPPQLPAPAASSTAPQSVSVSVSVPLATAAPVAPGSAASATAAAAAAAAAVSANTAATTATAATAAAAQVTRSPPQTGVAPMASYARDTSSAPADPAPRSDAILPQGTHSDGGNYTPATNSNSNSNSNTSNPATSAHKAAVAKATKVDPAIVKRKQPNQYTKRNNLIAAASRKTPTAPVVEKPGIPLRTLCACRIRDDNTAESIWILGTVDKYYPDTKKYDIIDAAEMDSGDQKVYRLTKINTVALAKSSHVANQTLPKHTRVLALYPDTTVFYPATVNTSAEDRGNGKYLLEFDDEEPDVSDPEDILTEVAARYVLIAPAISGQATSTFVVRNKIKA